MRLQQQAPSGTILLSAATYALVHTEVRATPWGTLTGDGSFPPMPLYAVQGRLGRHAGVAGRGPRVERPFVGRERELVLLHDHLTTAMGGQGQVIGLVGEPGMGKTRLLTEFCRRVSGNQVTVYEGRCLSYGQATPYLPVRGLVRQMCALVEGDTAAVHTAAVQHRLHACEITAADDVALVLQLLDLPVLPEHLGGRSPEAQRARTFALLRHLVLHTAPPQPLVLVMENLHWSDPTSDAWLASLVERVAGAAVLVLGTYRPGYQPTWAAHAAVTQVTVPPLHTQDSRTVVQAMLGTVALPEARLRAIVAQAGGNPFFLEELTWYAVEQDGVDTQDAVPETVHAVLAARMDRLSSEAKRLLQMAPVPPRRHRRASRSPGFRRGHSPLPPGTGFSRGVGHAPPPGPLPPRPGHALCQDRAAGAGPCCPGYGYCALPRHGHDLLAASGRGRAGTGGRAVMDYEAVLALLLQE